MVFGNFSKTKKKRRNLQLDLPVISSESWRELKRAKNREQEEADAMKKEKKEVRLKRKAEIENQKKEKEEKKKQRLQSKVNREQEKKGKAAKKNFKKCRKNSETESETDTEMIDNVSTSSSISDSMLEDEQAVLTDEKNVESTAPKQIDKRISVQDWVLVQYSGNEYPGRVISIDGTDYEVKTLESVVFCRKKLWRWPKREDKIFYNREDIIQVLPAPKSVKGRGRTTDLFEFTK